MAALLVMFQLLMTPFAAVLELGVLFSGAVMTIVFSVAALVFVFGGYLLKHYTRQLWRFLRGC